MVLGTIRCGLTISANLFILSSGTVITPTLGSIVQKGKFAACAFALDRQLNNVDLPTFGKPTIPHCKAMKISIFLNCTKITKSTDFWGLTRILHFLTISDLILRVCYAVIVIMTSK